MEETAGPSQTTFARSGSIVSRFKEQLSESSGSCSPICTQQCHASHPYHIIQKLKVERDMQRSHRGNTRQKPSKKRGTVAERRAWRMTTATALAYERRRSTDSRMVDEHRHAKESRKKHEAEHKRRSRLSGTVWGYNPMAGRLSEAHDSPSPDHHVHGCYIFRGARDDSDEYGVNEIDSLGRRTSRQWLQGSKWGIERGGPGREPHFECNHGKEAQREERHGCFA